MGDDEMKRLARQLRDTYPDCLDKAPEQDDTKKQVNHIAGVWGFVAHCKKLLSSHDTGDKGVVNE